MKTYPEDKKDCLAVAITITKEYARGGSDKEFPENVLKNTYIKLKELMEDANKQD